MKKLLLLFIITSTYSCLNLDNLDKFNSLTLHPDLLIPFVQIELDSKFYNEIYTHPDSTDVKIDMVVDIFQDIDLPKNVDTVVFNFNAINGFPIFFKEITFSFIDENNIVLDKISLTNINPCELNEDDGSLKTPSSKRLIPPVVFDSDALVMINNTRTVKVVMSWDKIDTTITPNETFYFNTFSDVIIKTKIEISK